MASVSGRRKGLQHRRHVISTRSLDASKASRCSDNPPEPSTPERPNQQAVLLKRRSAAGRLRRGHGQEIFGTYRHAEQAVTPIEARRSVTPAEREMPWVGRWERLAPASCLERSDDVRSIEAALVRVDRCTQLVPGLARGCAPPRTLHISTDVPACETLLSTGAITPDDWDPLARASFGPFECSHRERLERHPLVGGQRRRACARIGWDHDARRAWKQKEESCCGDGQRPSSCYDPTALGHTRDPAASSVASSEMSGRLMHEQRLRARNDLATACDGLVTSCLSLVGRTATRPGVGATHTGFWTAVPSTARNDVDPGLSDVPSWRWSSGSLVR